MPRLLSVHGRKLGLTRGLTLKHSRVKHWPYRSAICSAQEAATLFFAHQDLPPDLTNALPLKISSVSFGDTFEGPGAGLGE